MKTPVGNVVSEISRITVFLQRRNWRVSRDGTDAEVKRVKRGGEGRGWLHGVGMERDSAHADGSREHISKVCSQLIIGTLLPRLPIPDSSLFLSPPLCTSREGWETRRFEALLLPWTNLHGNRPCAGAIYGGRQIAKRTGAGRTWLSMLCAQFSQLHSCVRTHGGDASVRMHAAWESAENAIIITDDSR